jgi:hypothetical protein
MKNVSAKSAESFVFEVLYKVLTLKLATKFTYLGGKGKLPFAKLKINLCLQSSKTLFYFKTRN